MCDRPDYMDDDCDIEGFPLPSNEVFICVVKCPELDIDGTKHCQTTDPEFFAERYLDSCPTGRKPEWALAENWGIHNE